MELIFRHLQKNSSLLSDEKYCPMKETSNNNKRVNYSKQYMLKNKYVFRYVLEIILFIFSYPKSFVSGDIFLYFFVFDTHYVYKCISTKHLGKLFRRKKYSVRQNISWDKIFVELIYSLDIIFVTSKSFATKEI